MRMIIELPDGKTEADFAAFDRAAKDCSRMVADIRRSITECLADVIKLAVAIEELKARPAKGDVADLAERVAALEAMVRPLA